MVKHNGKTVMEMWHLVMQITHMYVKIYSLWYGDFSFEFQPFLLLFKKNYLFIFLVCKLNMWIEQGGWSHIYKQESQVNKQKKKKQPIFLLHTYIYIKWLL